MTATQAPTPGPLTAAIDMLFEARDFIDRFSDVIDGEYGTSEPNAACTFCGSTTPTRAEAQDEGAALERERIVRIIDQIEVVTGAHGPRIRLGEKLRVTNAILAHPSPPPAADEDRVRAWDSFAAHINWELSHGYPDGEEEDGCWMVHSVNGGRNDREWTLIGRGETPLDAALAALKSEGK